MASALLPEHMFGEWLTPLPLVVTLFALTVGFLVFKTRRIRDGVHESSGTTFVQPYRASQAPVTRSGEAASHVGFNFERMRVEDMKQRATAFADFLTERRSVRFFSPDPVPLDVLQECIRAAGTAPSGAHCQPWTFVVIRDLSLRRKIREVVEAEEKLNYERRMGQDWVDDVQPLVAQLHEDGVSKPYLEHAPFLVAVMKQVHGLAEDGSKIRHWYPAESVGIATGMFIAALHNANLATLTSTPLGAGSAITRILGRPSNEKVYVLMPIGWPARDATVPYRAPADLRKPLPEIMAVV